MLKSPQSVPNAARLGLTRLDLIARTPSVHETGSRSHRGGARASPSDVDLQERLSQRSHCSSNIGRRLGQNLLDGWFLLNEVDAMSETPQLVEEVGSFESLHD